LSGMVVPWRSEKFGASVQGIRSGLVSRIFEEKNICLYYRRT